MLRLILRINHWLIDELGGSAIDVAAFVLSCAAVGWLLFESLFPALP